MEISVTNNLIKFVYYANDNNNQIETKMLFFRFKK